MGLGITPASITNLGLSSLIQTRDKREEKSSHNSVDLFDKLNAVVKDFASVTIRTADSILDIFSDEDSDQEVYSINDFFANKDNESFLDLLNQLGFDKDSISGMLKQVISDEQPKLKQFTNQDDLQAILEARKNNQHYVGEAQIDGVSKELIKIVSLLSNMKIEDAVDKLRTGKNLEDQKHNFTDEQYKNLNEIIDNLKDPNKINEYLNKIREKGLQQIKDFESNKGSQSGPNPAGMRLPRLGETDNQFVRDQIKNMMRLKLWEESQKWQNSYMASILTALHDSIKLSASAQG